MSVCQSLQRGAPTIRHFSEHFMWVRKSADRSSLDMVCFVYADTSPIRCMGFDIRFALDGLRQSSQGAERSFREPTSSCLSKWMICESHVEFFRRGMQENFQQTHPWGAFSFFYLMSEIAGDIINKMYVRNHARRFLNDILCVCIRRLKGDFSKLLWLGMLFILKSEHPRPRKRNSARFAALSHFTVHPCTDVIFQTEIAVSTTLRT